MTMTRRPWGPTVQRCVRSGAGRAGWGARATVSDSSVELALRRTCRVGLCAPIRLGRAASAVGRPIASRSGP